MSSKKKLKVPRQPPISNAAPPIQPVPQPTADKPSRRFGNANLILTIISVTAAVVSAYAAWQGFSASRPKETLGEWSISNYQTDKSGQLQRLSLKVLINNVGGATSTLIDARTKYTYKPSSSPTSHPPGAPSAGPITVTESPSPSSSSQIQVFRSEVISRVNALGVVEPLIQIQGKSRIVVEFPGIENRDEAIKVFGDTGLLNFVDAGDTYSAFCLASRCYGIIDKQRRDTFVYTKPNAFHLNPSDSPPATGTGSSVLIEPTPTDELPVGLLPGESKAIFLEIYMPYFDTTASLDDLEVALSFNDGTTINVPVLDQLR